MTNEEKQALIEHCQRVLKGSNTVGVLGEVYQIALAALTAQPVKLAELVPDEKWINPAPGFESEDSYSEGFNACRSAILRNIEGAK